MKNPKIKNDQAGVSNPILDPEKTISDTSEKAVRPKCLNEFIGQSEVSERLDIFLQAAKKRDEALDHVLLSGPAGLGKTTMALIIATEMKAQLRATQGPVLERAGDLAALLTNVATNDVLFIDEIHRLRPNVEEILYSAMEDFTLDIIIGEGPKARAIKINLPPFTLVGATTRAGLLTPPLRDRFGIIERFNFYETKDLEDIVGRSARLMGIEIDAIGKKVLAARARGTPRIVNRLLRRVRDYVDIKANGIIDGPNANAALDLLKVDRYGLDIMDRKLLTLLTGQFSGRAVGIESLAAAMGEERDTLEEVVEPFLILRGYMERSARGRCATAMSYTILGIESPANV